MSDEFSDFLMKIQTSGNYLKMDALKDGFSYKIYGRQAYVGVWVKYNKSF